MVWTYNTPVRITWFKLCSRPNYAIHYIVGVNICSPIKIKITQLFQKQRVITQLTKTLSVALVFFPVHTNYTCDWNKQAAWKLFIENLFLVICFFSWTCCILFSWTLFLVVYIFRFTHHYRWSTATANVHDH